MCERTCLMDMRHPVFQDRGASAGDAPQEETLERSAVVPTARADGSGASANGVYQCERLRLRSVGRRPDGATQHLGCFMAHLLEYAER